MPREMDGHPIPGGLGGPVRMIVPGAYGSPIKPRVWPRTSANAIQQVALLVEV